MKSRSVLMPQAAFWGVCLIGAAWIVASVFVEAHLGWPATTAQWLKRSLGWAVEIWLLRTLVLGSRRYATAISKP
jgi:hypothetical protein